MPSSLVPALLLLLSVFLSASFSRADNHGVTFLFPTPELTVNVGDTVNVTYTSNFSHPHLYTFCQNATGSNIVTELIEQVPTNGSELIQLPWTNVSLCWFDLRPNDTAGNGANSPSITIASGAGAEPGARPVTVGLAQPTTTSGSPSSTKSGSSSATSSAATHKPSSSDSSGNGGSSDRTKVGIGVGVAVGVIVGVSVAAATFFLLRRRNARAKVAGGTDAPAYQSVEEDSLELDSNEQRKKKMPQGVIDLHELSAPTRYEMPVNQVMHEMSTDGAVQPDRRRFSWEE